MTAGIRRRRKLWSWDETRHVKRLGCPMVKVRNGEPCVMADRHYGGHDSREAARGAKWPIGGRFAKS